MSPFFLRVLRPYPRRGEVRAVLFDFDGTLSLIRAGWQEVMIPLMVEIIREETATQESDEELRAIVTDFVDTLTGRQTIYQMIRLAEEIAARGGKPRDPIEYKRIYHERLERYIAVRKEELRTRPEMREKYLVPGSVELLQMLRGQGLVLYLASGTDLPYVREECDLLGLTPYFEPHIYGAIDEYWRFSKRQVIRKILTENKLHGGSLVAFGDGYVEIEETVRVGGLAVGVVSSEQSRGGVSGWKVRRLRQAGAHALIPHYVDTGAIASYLWSPH